MPRLPRRRRSLVVATFIAALFSLAVIGRSGAEDQTSALINQALDKQINLTLKALLPQAMDTVTQQTGVPVKADAAVWDLLPWGRDTNINATIQNQTLREALNAITQKLGLTWSVKDDAVTLQPMPALRRLARRSTVQELKCLDTLAGLQLGQSGSMTIKQLLDEVDAKLSAAKSEFVVDRPAADTVSLDAKVEVSRNSNALDALEKMAAQTGATWYPWGKSVVVLSKQDEVKRQLARTITARYNRVDVTQVLTDLSQRSGVRFDVEAGAVQAIPPESRSLNISYEDATIQDVLDSISGTTGLDYMVKDAGVYLWNQTSNTTHRDRAIMMVPIQGTNINVFITESQLTPDEREFIKYKVQKEMKNLHDMMKEENFKPSSASTQPAPQPAPPTKPAKANEDL